MSERQQLEEAISALEAQRNILGDSVVDPAIAGLREKQAGLAEDKYRQKRKQVTVLYAVIPNDVSISESIGAKEFVDSPNPVLEYLKTIILEHNGVLDKHVREGVIALWGGGIAREDDPERAVLAALSIREGFLGLFRSKVLETDVKDKPVFRLRIGIHTGQVLLGGEGNKEEYFKVDDTINLASRLAQAAPDRGVVISHATYRHVRGVFDMQAQAPLKLGEENKPVRRYLVRRAKPRAFRMETWGVEGIETRMVGREAEMLTLQDIFRDAMEDKETRIVTVVGEAGIGKSRLLYEFENWIELLPEEVFYFKGWGGAGMQIAPYGAIRRMFAHKYEILVSDSPTQVMNKLRAGLATVIGPERADLVGHLIGFDIPTSKALQRELENESFLERALESLVEFFRVVSSKPTVIFLEDIQWVDDSSLDLVDQLAVELTEAKLLVVCLARITLFERRPAWGEGKQAHICLELTPLSRRESRVLVGEILQKMEEVPEKLKDLVVQGSEGNPFYVEEIIKMLVDEGVIRGGKRSWSVHLDRLAETHVPPTLTGVIQARLDGLPEAERAVLQMAAVVGRQFWDSAVAELAAEEEQLVNRGELDDLFEALRGRELIYRRERSTFANTEEYIFKHALLRDVTYETVPLEQRKEYHKHSAVWLEAAAGERVGEFLGSIAGHYELAGESGIAVNYLLKAGDRARLAYANHEAVEYYRRALKYQQEPGEHANAARTLMKIGLVYHTAFDYQRSRKAYEQGFALWRQAEEKQPSEKLNVAPHAFRMSRAKPTTLDPTMADDSFSGGIINQLFCGLVEGRLAMETVPDVTRSWELSADGCRYVFHLRDDVRWSDGVPVTAGDFEYAWKRILEPANRSPNASLLYDIMGARAFHNGEMTNPYNVGVKATGDFTLQVNLECPTGYFLSLLAHYATFPVPRHVLEVYGTHWTELNNIVTNGAFRIEDWVRGRSMILKRNPEYHGRFPGNLQRIDLSFDVEWSDQLQMYEDGDLEFISFGGTPLERDRARRRHAGEYYSTPMLGATYIGFDVSRPPFDDSRVRRAFALATNKEKLADEVLRGYELPALGGFVSPGMPGHSADISPPYDPKRAQELLAEAGYPDGARFPDLDAWTWLGIKNRAEELQAQWMENLGVDVTWKVVDFTQFIEQVDAAPRHMIQTAWMPDYPDPDSFLRASPIRRRAHWQNEIYEELVEKARRVLNQAERLELYSQADRILVDKQTVIIPLTYMWSHILVKPWVHRLPSSAINEWLWKDFVIEEH